VDSITQAVLGAAVSEVLLGKKLGWRAAAWGAFLGTLPDLDVFAMPWLDEAERIRWHRGISHSILVVVLASFAFAWPLARLHRQREVKPKTMGWMVFWVLSTHVLIDCFTTYGTQIFEPFSDQRVSLNNMAIIDPLFTLPLIIGLVCALRFDPGDRRRVSAMWKGVGVSCLYVIFSFVMKGWAMRSIHERVVRDLPGADVVAVSPTIFNSILWRGLIEVEEDYMITYWSPFDESESSYDDIPKLQSLAVNYEGKEIFEALKWFARGHWIARTGEDGKVVLVDMRFSEIRDRESGHMMPIFQWHMSLDKSGEMTAPSMRPEKLNYRSAMSLLWSRMWGKLDEWENFKPF